MVTHPEESYQLWCVDMCVIYINLLDEVIALAGPQRRKKSKQLGCFFCEVEIKCLCGE